MPGLSCRYSEGRIFRHAALNDIIHRALATANVPSQLEPVGVSRTDGKRPDGITSVPWKSGKHLVWDATVTDTFVPSYLYLAAREAEAVAAAAEERKKIKYSNLTLSYCFTPVAVETSGVLGPATMNFIKDLGRRSVDPSNRERGGHSPHTTKNVRNCSTRKCCLCHGFLWLCSSPYVS